MTAEADFSLGRTHDLIAEGALDELCAPSKVKIDRGWSTLFGVGERRIRKIVIEFCEQPEDELAAKLIEAIRRLVGNKAHIEDIS
ncbi:MAG: hypothetical protein AAGK00_00590 [Pseudomonadota bacterium]